MAKVQLQREMEATWTISPKIRVEIEVKIQFIVDQLTFIGSVGHNYYDLQM